MCEPSADAVEKRGMSAWNAVGSLQVRRTPLFGDDLSVLSGSCADPIVLFVPPAALASLQLGESSDAEQSVRSRLPRSWIYSKISWLLRLRSI